MPSSLSYPLSHRVFIDHNGRRPTGVAFVVLLNAQEAAAAMAKHMQIMSVPGSSPTTSSSRYIEIFPNPDQQVGHGQVPPKGLLFDRGVTS